MPGPFVVVGESLVDIVVTPEGDVSEAVGGSPMNVAAGLARLGVPSLLITLLGDDERGRRVAEHLSASGVDVAPGSVQAGRTTSTATARLNEHRTATYEFDLAWDLPQWELPAGRGLHVGSLGASLEPGRRSTVDLVGQATASGLFVSYDPNVRPAFVTDTDAAWKDLADLAAECSLVKISDEDLTALRPGEPVERIAQEIVSAGRTELVIVTQGAGGSWAFQDGTDVHVVAPRVKVADTVGAGDSFMSATLAVLAEWGVLEAGAGALASLPHDRVRTLLRGAMAAAAVTCSRVGANPPTRAELPDSWPE